MRHGRHHAALHQAQLAGEERRRSRAHPARGLLCRAYGPAGSRRGRYSQGRAVCHRHLHRPQGRQAQDLSAAHQGRSCSHRQGRRDHEPGQEAGALHRRRRDQLRAEGQQAAARAGASHGLSDHLDAHGARGVSGLGQGVARHARHARHLRGQPRHARLRRHGVHRRALRRSHHRAHRSVLAALQEDPHRHRSLVDQQERARRCAGDRRRRLRAGRADPHLEDEGGDGRQDRAQDLVGARSKSGGPGSA